MSISFDVVDARDYDDCIDLLQDTIAKASNAHTEAQGLLLSKDSDKKSELMQAEQHNRQIRKLQRPVSKQTASIPHIYTLFWRACRGGMRLEINIPATLASVSQDSHPAFIYTSAKGLVELVEGPQAADAFLRSLPKRGKHQLSPLAIHHTSVGSASLYFTRRAVKSALRNLPSTFNYLQVYIENKTQSPELLCVDFRPGKPTKFYIVVQRRVGTRDECGMRKTRLQSLVTAANSWLLNRSDHYKSEILDCSQADASLSQQSERIHHLLVSFHIAPVSELITDYIRDKSGAWVFKSIVNIVVDEPSEKSILVRPRTASSVSHPSLSLSSKVKPVQPKPKPYAFTSATSIISNTLLKKNKPQERAESPTKKPAVQLEDIESRLRALQMPRPPRLKQETLGGFHPTSHQRFSEDPAMQKLNCRKSLPTPVNSEEARYVSLLAGELTAVSQHYDTMRRSVKEFQDRRANPRRCIYYYPDMFWRDVAAYVTSKLLEDPKTFPMYIRMEPQELLKLVSQLIEELKKDVFPTPVDFRVVELCVELSIPRLDAASFIAILRDAFQLYRMRQDELEVAVSVYRENLQQLLSLNWKKNFTSFLTKKVMSPEFVEKVMKLKDLEVRSLPDEDEHHEEIPKKSFSMMLGQIIRTHQ